MAKEIQIDVAELAGIIAEGALFGVSLVFLLASLYILTAGRMRRSRVNAPMVAACVLMLCLVFAQLVIDSVNIFQAFIDTPDRKTRLLHLVNVTNPIFAAKHSIYFAMMLVGDAIVIWRAFVVWNKNFWVILLPTLCALGSGACAWQTIYATQHIATASITEQARFGYAIFALSLLANGISTGLIVWRIWTHHRSFNPVASNYRSSSLVPVVMVVVESGAINAAYILAYLVVETTGSHGLEVMACISTPLIGVIFSAVILRAGLASQRQETSTVAGSSIPMPSYNRSQASARTVVEITSESHKWTDQEDYEHKINPHGAPIAPLRGHQEV